MSPTPRIEIATNQGHATCKREKRKLKIILLQKPTSSQHLETPFTVIKTSDVRYILPEGDGLLDKGMKLEWATEKDGSLIVGSFGKEFTDNQGRVVNTNNNWVITIDPSGAITREDWSQEYK